MHVSTQVAKFASIYFMVRVKSRKKIIIWYSIIHPVSLKIQWSQNDVQLVKDEAHTLLGEVAVKNTKLADLEVSCKLLKLRRDILRGQKEKLAESKTELSGELVRRLRSCHH